MNYYLVLLVLFVSLTSYCHGEKHAHKITVSLNANITLNCADIQNGMWYAHNLTSNKDEAIHTHDKFSIQQNNSLLITKLESKEVAVEYHCKGIHGSVKYKLNGLPHLDEFKRNSTSVVIGGFVSLNCKVVFGHEQNQSLKWEWKLNNKTLVNDSRIEILEKNNITSELVVRKLSLEDKGEIICAVFNGYGYHTQKIQLRIKDIKGALWPFLAIVGEVIVLSVIVLVIEKKFGKKTTTYEYEGENLMSKQKNNENNNELKKRTVKA